MSEQVRFCSAQKVLAASADWDADLGGSHYRDNATEYKKQRDEKAQARQSDVAALDAKYTQELADERARNNKE